MKEIINHIPVIRKMAAKLSEPVDVDLTTLINRKSTYESVKERFEGMTRYELFAFGFMMYGFGVFSGIGYIHGIQTGNKFIMSIEAASGVMFVIALTFLIAFIAALTAKVKRWK